MDEPIKVYKNMIWEILSDESKLFILELLIQSEFKGDCKLISVVEGGSTIMEIRDNYDHYMVLPINILDILNE
jgi:hypothetical protein